MKKLLMLSITLLVMGCSEQVEDVSEVESVAQDAEIEWFDGSIEEAFAQAKADEVPVFLYWGAIWCPPCMEIKSTVFKSQEFINLTKLFVPVYLDGDTDRAQAWGEKFGVKGYPTMIVFNPAGEEVTRIPGGIDISKYNSILELSLNQMRPTRQLVELSLTDADSLTPNDFMQLAYYSWGQDSGALPDGEDVSDMFYQLSTKAPQAEARARFYMQYLVRVTRQHDPEENPEVSLADGHEVMPILTEILSSEELTLACWDSLAYYVDDILELPVYSDEEREQLASQWENQLFTLRDSDSLSKAEKMAGWLPKLYIGTRDDQELSDEVKNQLREEMQLVDRNTPDTYERQSVINQMGYIYRNAGMVAEARELLHAELEKSASPYYFMSGLAVIAEKEENFSEAVEWRKKAYEASTGEATRFQWGTNYVLTMIKLTPENSDAIVQQSVALLDEFHETNEVFAGRNFRVLRRLNSRLADWQTDRELSELAFRDAVRTMCDSQTPGSIEAENCESLFVEEALTQT